MQQKSIFGDKIITPAGRVSFPYVFERNSTGPYADDKYKLTLLIPKDAKGVDELKKAVLAVAKKAFGAKTKLSDIAHPFNDGDAKLEETPDESKEKYTAYAGCYYLNLKNKYKPKVVDENVQEILDESEFYPGCWARCSVVPFSYRQGKNRGVSLRLLNIQKVKDDERFGGGGSDPASEFSAVGESVDETVPFDDDDEDFNI